MPFQSELLQDKGHLPIHDLDLAIVLLEQRVKYFKERCKFLEAVKVRLQERITKG